MDNRVLGFLTLGINHNVKNFQLQNSEFLANFLDFDIFRKHLNFKCL
jgi:hypothetical protein